MFINFIYEYPKTAGYLAIHVVTWIYMRWSLEPLIKAQKDKAFCEKYAAFIRKDLGNLKLVNFPLYLTFYPRIIATWGICVIFAFILSLVTIGTDP